MNQAYRLLIGVLFGMVAATVGVAGTISTTVMTRASGTAEIKTWVDGQNLKSEVVSSNDRSCPEGLSIVSRDGGATLTVIFAAKQQYMSFSRQEYEALQKSKFASGLIILEPMKVTRVSEEDGEKIVGISTHHYKINFLLVLGHQDGTPPSHFSVDEDVWTAVNLPRQPEMSDLLFKQTLGIAELDRALKHEDIPGFRLKRTVNLSINGTSVGESNVEVKQLSPGILQEPEMEIPSSYTKKEIPQKQGP